MTNIEISKILKAMAVFYEMDGAAFKPRAYEKAAEAVAALREDVKDIWKRGGEKALEEIPGVGPAIAGHLIFLMNGRLFPEYRRLKRKYPFDLDGLGGIEGLGPKTILLLWKKLGIKDLKDLERAASSGKIRDIPHLGEKTEQNILRGVEFMRQSAGRIPLGYILPLAEDIESRLGQVPGVKHAVICGSIRRRKETIGDIDILVTTSHPKEAVDYFISMPEVQSVYAQGEGKASVRLKIGIDADLRVVPDESFGAATQYFTGDKQHNVHVRTIAIKKGYKLNEYGLFRGKKNIARKTEEEIYKKLGMDLMPPEIRTDTGEVEAALAHKLPNLISYGAARGDLQTTTNWTDGAKSIREMALYAKKLGLEYIAITDHTKALAMTGGLDERGLERQGREIEKLNREIKEIRILKSAEVNILKDGSLDILDEALAKLDIVGAAVHTNFNMPEAEMTERIIRAMKNPNVDIIFHPTGRLLGRREPYKVNMAKLITAAKVTGTVLEIDAFPDRMDLCAEHARMAVKAGVKLSIDTDAHAPEHLEYLDLGVAMARAGWARKSDIVNTMPLKEFLAWLKKPKSKR
ncbi:MAG: DNA polymerase/3'-5' exonuclease PolX [Patescibacteria group bacterium]